MEHDAIKADNEKPTVAGRDLEDFLVDPNFQGAFVGGPPLMTTEEAKKIIEQPEVVQSEALARLEKFWKDTANAEDDAQAPKPALVASAG